jgi:1-acyl-sn-glycerol-3-phosphate acyltransferase
VAEQRFQGQVLRWLARGEATSWAQDPNAYDPRAVQRTLQPLDLAFGPHRPWEVTVGGFEHVPAAPVILVSNHSGGTVIPDAWALGWSWYRHFGLERPLHFLAHEWVLPFRALGEALGRRGVLWANHEIALRALCDMRRDLVIFPGGDLDSWRPYRRRWEVEFGGHTGYARLALETGVPILPVAHAGAQETFRVLTDGRRIARWLQLTRLARAHVFPVHLSLPWGLGIGPLPHLPWPARMHFRIGRPIRPTAPRTKAVSGDAVAQLDQHVRSAVQSLLHELARSRGKR